jgi:hypothetical protein
MYIFAESFKTKKRMKKLLFIGLLFVAGNISGQTLTKEQEKQVKSIHKQVEKEVDGVVDNPQLTAEEKKSRIYAAKDRRDARLEETLTHEQAAAVKLKDPVKWNRAVDRVDRAESAKLKGEMHDRMKVIDEQDRELDTKEDDIDMRMKILKKEKEEIGLQRKALKQQRKTVKAQYAK